MAEHSEAPQLSDIHNNTPGLGGKRGLAQRPLSADEVGWYRILNRAGRLQALPRLVNTLKFGTPDARWQAALSLGIITDETATKALIEALRDENARVRAAVTRAIGRRRDPLLLPNLLDASRDADPVVREAAARALGGLGSESARDTIRAQTAARLGELLHDQDSSTRQAAAAMLGWLGGREASSQLASALFSNNLDVRTNASTVIQWLQTAPEANHPFERMHAGRRRLYRSALPLVDLLVGPRFPSTRLVLYSAFFLGLLALLISSLLVLGAPTDTHVVLQMLTILDAALVLLLPPVAGWLTGTLTRREVRSQRYELLRRTLLSKMQIGWSYVLTAMHRLRILYGLMFTLMPISAVWWVQFSLASNQSYGEAISNSLIWVLIVVNTVSLSLMSGAIFSSMALWQNSEGQAVGLLLIITFLQINLLMLIVAPQLMFPQIEALMAVRLSVMLLPYALGGWFIYLARSRA